jgi:hypothetical protein
MNFKNLKYTAFIQFYSLFKLPLLAFAGPRIQQLDQEKCIVKIPLGYRTRNHLGVMYFGALAMGAELSIAATAVFAIQESKQKIDFIFKDFKMNFLKRADGDVHFICIDAQSVRELIATAKSTSDRVENTFKGYAIVPSKGDTVVAEFELTLSVKKRGT